MSLVDGLLTIAKKGAIGVAAGILLPIFGLVGAITAAGIAVTSLIGVLWRLLMPVHKKEED